MTCVTHDAVMVGPSDRWLDLRILATTDLHMNLAPPAGTDKGQAARGSLAQLAPLIARYRKSAVNSLLFDNGDFLHGTPLGDDLAEAGADEAPHPMIAAMNRLAYDAVSIGNHDFAYGPEFLCDALAAAQFSVCSSNLSLTSAAPIQRRLMLTRELRDRSGRGQQIFLGIIGVLPVQTPDWDRSLRPKLSVEDMAEAVTRESAALRQMGADLIILLAHSGLGPVEYDPQMENAATALASLPGVDAVIAGHTHLVFPDPETRAPLAEGIDHERGTLAGKPAVMAGFWGSHLGVIDLVLAPLGPPAPDQRQRWRIESFHSRAEPAAGLPPDPEIVAILRPAEAKARESLAQQVGSTGSRLSSHFALLGLDGSQSLVAAAKIAHATEALRQSPWRELPVLAVTSPIRAGGRSGPGHYLDLPAGPIRRSDLFDLYPFPNRLVALRAEGRQILQWLEIAAGLFRMVSPGDRDRALILGTLPGYHFDMFHGLEWRIDLSQPASPDGRPSRIHDLLYQGQPVAPDQSFILVTNSYRMTQSGPYGAVTAACEIVLDQGERVRDIIRRHLTHAPFDPSPIDPSPSGPAFRLLAPKGCTAIFETAPQADLSGPRPLPYVTEPLGLTPAGFQALRLYL